LTATPIAATPPSASPPSATPSSAETTGAGNPTPTPQGHVAATNPEGHTITQSHIQAAENHYTATTTRLIIQKQTPKPPV
jgi:hypothetical protein